MNTIPIEVSVKGKTVVLLGVCIQGRNVVVTGKWLKTATIHDEEWLSGEMLHDPEQFVTLLRESRQGADIFSFASAQPDVDPGYDYHREWDNIAVIRTESYSNWWNGLSQDSRRNVRLAGKRGVKVCCAEFDDRLVEGIKGIYNETPVRQGRRFWHYGKDDATVRHDNATYLDRSVFVAAYYGDELIGFIKMVHVDKTAKIMQILSKNEHFDKRPANAMIAKAVEICAQDGKSFLAYCRYVYGNKKNSSITEFKRRNGFEELRFPRYYVPLTWKGRMALRCGMHLGIKNVLPESLTDRLLAMRSQFYEKFGDSKKTDPSNNPRSIQQAPSSTGD